MNSEMAYSEHTRSLTQVIGSIPAVDSMAFVRTLNLLVLKVFFIICCLASPATSLPRRPGRPHLVSSELISS